MIPTLERNPGLDFDSTRLDAMRINRSAVERRAATLVRRRSLKLDHQAAWLLKAISCIDLTTLAGDDTPGTVRRLCLKARQPVRREILDALGVADMGITNAAVCVYHNLIATAVECLHGSDVRVAAVSTGFPAGQIPLSLKLQQIEASVAEGASEIDIVINRGLCLTGQWRQLYSEIRACREACGDAHMKTILATGDLATMTMVARASWVAMMAGSDFIKTSTGKEGINATLPVSLVMCRALRDYCLETNCRIGFKPAGGIRTAKQALEYLILIKEELGAEWLTPALFRFGASGLLGDIERQLEHRLTGAYSAAFRHPMN